MPLEQSASQIMVEHHENELRRQTFKADLFCFYEAMANHYLACTQLSMALRRLLEHRRLLQSPDPNLDDLIKRMAVELEKIQIKQLGQKLEP